MKDFSPSVIIILSSDLNFPEKTFYSCEKTISAQEGQEVKGKAKITLMAGPIVANKTGYDPK